MGRRECRTCRCSKTEVDCCKTAALTRYHYARSWTSAGDDDIHRCRSTATTARHCAGSCSSRRSLTGRHGNRPRTGRAAGRCRSNRGSTAAVGAGASWRHSRWRHGRLRTGARTCCAGAEGESWRHWCSRCPPTSLLQCHMSAGDSISVARILSGAVHFFLDLFLVVALKDRLNIAPNLTRPAKTQKLS